MARIPLFTAAAARRLARPAGFNGTLAPRMGGSGSPRAVLPQTLSPAVRKSLNLILQQPGFRALHGSASALEALAVAAGKDATSVEGVIGRPGGVDGGNSASSSEDSGSNGGGSGRVDDEDEPVTLLEGLLLALRLVMGMAAYAAIIGGSSALFVHQGLTKWNAYHSAQRLLWDGERVFEEIDSFTEEVDELSRLCLGM